jgi:hypothetical protein
MRAQTDFASRVARIEARNSGKGPKQPVIAPFVGEDVNSMERLMRPKRGGLGRAIVMCAGVLFCGALFANDLAPYLPSAMQPPARALAIAFDETLSDTIGRVAEVTAPSHSVSEPAPDQTAEPPTAAN